MSQNPGSSPSEFPYGMRVPLLSLAIETLQGAASSDFQITAGVGVPSGDEGITNDKAWYINTSGTTIPTMVYSTIDGGETWVALSAATLTTLTVSGAITAGAAVTIAGALSVTGAVTAASTLAVTGAVTAASTLAVTGAVTASSTMSVAGALTSTAPITTTRGIASGAALKVGGRRASGAALGTAHTNSTTETVLVSDAIEASAFANAGDVLEFFYAFQVNAAAGATTAEFYLRLTATTLVGTPLLTVTATDVVANDIVIIQGFLTAQGAAGASANIAGGGTYNLPAQPGAGAMLPFLVTPTARATNAALILEVSADLSAADATSVLAVTRLVKGPA